MFYYKVVAYMKRLLLSKSKLKLYKGTTVHSFTLESLAKCLVEKRRKKTLQDVIIVSNHFLRKTYA